MSQVITYQRYWMRRDTIANWTSINPTLHSGEIGVEQEPTDTAGEHTRIKIGDGVTAWNDLEYFGGSGGGSKSALTEIFSAGGSLEYDCALGDYFTHLMTENTTLSFINPPAAGFGRKIRGRFQQDSTTPYQITLSPPFYPMAGSDTGIRADLDSYSVFEATTYDFGGRWEYMLLAAGDTVPAVTWSSTDHDAALLTSGGDLTITKSGVGTGWKSGRATYAHASGKWYFEIYLAAGSPSPSPGVMVGLAVAAMNLGNYVGADGNGQGYYCDNGNKTYAGLAAYAATWDVGDVIGVAYDAGTGTNGTIEFFKNNVSQGVAFTNCVPSMFPAVSIYYGSSVASVVGRFKASDFTYSPPSGYSPWGT